MGERRIEEILDNTGQHSVSYIYTHHVGDDECWRCKNAQVVEGHTLCDLCLRWMRGEDVLSINPGPRVYEDEPWWP